MSKGCTNQLAPGNILLHNETLFVVEEFRGGSVTVGQLGHRQVDGDKMYSVGDDCPAPGCAGEIVADEPDRQTCSEGCLEWSLNHRREGQDCPSHCDDGTVVEENARDGRYCVTCTECSRFAFGPEFWRERWLTQAKEDALEQFCVSGTDAEIEGDQAEGSTP